MPDSPWPRTRTRFSRSRASMAGRWRRGCVSQCCESDSFHRMKHLALILGAAAIGAACNNDITGLEPASDPATETFAASLNVNVSQMSKTKEGVYVRDVTPGSGLT